MTAQTEFIVKMLATLAAAGIAWFFMLRAQKRKQEAADQQFEITMKSIELRNRKVDDESQKKT